MAPHTKKYYRPILSSYRNLWEVCAITVFQISNCLAVKHKKNAWPVEGATYQKNIHKKFSYQIGMMTFIHVSNLTLLGN